MQKKILNSRNTFAIAICLAAMTMFVSCERDASLEIDASNVKNLTFEECIDITRNLPLVKFSVEFTKEGVNITHYLLNVNCDFNTVLITPSLVNRDLIIIERGEPNSAKCFCQTNVSYTISGVSEQDVDQIIINSEAAWTANQQPNNLLIGKWVTSDYNSYHNDTIHFTPVMRIEDYFIFMHTTLYHASSYYFTYSLEGNSIEITSHQPETAKFSESFEYLLNDNSLTIKSFSNPFSLTAEARTDVSFTKVE